MKRIIFCLLITTGLYAQISYEVVPNTKGNEIILSVANESRTINAGTLIVTLVNNPKGIEVCNTRYEIDKLKIGEEKEAYFSFDAKRIPGTHKDTLKFLIADNKGRSWTKEIILTYTLPKEFRLEQNYPNPFNPSTTIEYTIPQKGRYSLSIFNTLGQLVKVLVEEEYEAGYYKASFDSTRYASGMYIYRLGGENVNLIKKMLLVK